MSNVYDLGFLIEFLNFEFDRLDEMLAEDELDGFSREQLTQRRLAGIRGRKPHRRVIQFLEKFGLLSLEKRAEAKKIRDVLSEDLRVIAVGHDRGSKGSAVILGYIEKLMQKINERLLSQSLVLESSRAYVTLDDGRLVKRTIISNVSLSESVHKIRLHGGNYVVSERAVDCSPKDHLYLIIRRALLNDDLRRLGMCNSCERFFSRFLSRQSFCGAKCRDNFHNRTRLNNGRFQVLRKQRRKQAINTAKRLIRGGSSFEDVREETKLPRRVLENIWPE